MSERNTVLRSLHDVGLAAWFGGSLMGAVGLNGAARTEGGGERGTARIAASGWEKWSPVNAAAIGCHLIGTSGLLAVNAHRVALQQGVATSTLAKTVLTGAALAATAYSGVLGRKIRLASSDRPEDAQKAAGHPVDIATAQRHLACMQWLVPALTGGLVILNALHGEQQRPAQQVHGMWQRARSLGQYAPSLPTHVPVTPHWALTH
ncbi:hypothetical protein ABZ883_41740 [Streptomyces sp. NPDC046977]|uniref:hypothetical protein n=1 Tax=Streptomyces sp. NPDC046977 TaxID=3154703 RepID=UPI0033CBFF44